MTLASFFSWADRFEKPKLENLHADNCMFWAMMEAEGEVRRL